MLFRSTLAELEASPCTTLAILFPLDLTCVARQVSGLFQRFPVLLGDLEQRPADSVLNSASLTTDAAAAHIDADIILAGRPCEFKGLHDDHLQCFPHQIRIRIPFVDEDLALTGLEVYPSNGCLPPACAVELIFSHSIYPRLNYDLFRLLCLVRMIGPGIHLELGYHLGCEPIFGKHPFDRDLDDLLRFANEHLSCSHALDPARIT
jgi:hypothetical protein